MVLELRKILLRNTTDNQRGRATDFLGKHYVPALLRSGAVNAGLFGAAVAADSPFALVAASYPNYDAFDQVRAKMWGDPAFFKEVERATSGALLYERMEVTLLKGFPYFPGIEVSGADASRPPRIFELRTYESNNLITLGRKIKMFCDGEIDIFRKYGLAPVFFGEVVAGTKMPCLTYMVGFDNLAAREANWRAFATSPEWKKLAATPGLSDGEVVSNISNLLLTPLAGSQVR